MSAPAIRWTEIDPQRIPELWVVVGPTASGKSELAIRLCERWNGEIVSADSVQVYKYFDLGSGKPSAAEKARAPHHLIDLNEPDVPLDAGAYAALADAAIADIRARGKQPVVCGGTFLWVKALVRGLAEGAPANPELREQHRLLAEREGRAALHEQLRLVDPTAAAQLNPNDFIRVSRALEVFAVAGIPQSEWHRQHAFATERHPHKLFRVQRKPEELDRRIAKRVEGWLEQGWVAEVRSLIERGFGDTRAMGSVGYREVKAFLEGEVPESELAQRIVQKTRIFVRRQRTWLRDLELTEVELEDA